MTKFNQKLSEETVLVLAATDKDALFIVASLKLARIKAVPCIDIYDLCERLNTYFGAVLVSQEALNTEQAALLQAKLQKQEAWSDIPIILITGTRVAEAAKLFSTSGNISLLEKPYAEITLIRSVEVALRSRRKQYEVRFLLEALKRSKDQAENAHQTKSQFLSNMSHEMRTPLGAILGFTNLMKDTGNSSQENLNYLSVIERNSQHLLRLIDDTLDLSKIDSGKMTINRLQFNFADWLNDFDSMMSFKALDKGIKFNLNLDSSIPNIIATDPIRLKQVLSNVVGNAIKFTAKGSVQLSIDYQFPELKFTISDTGIGISQEQSQNLFQAFTQVDSTTTRKYGGTGLGLILSKRIASALGGDLVLKESQLLKGSTFIFTTRINLPSESKLMGQEDLHLLANDSFQDEEKLKGLNVLLVEDSPDNQTLIEIFLNKTGVHLQTVSDGLQGVEKALKENFDVVLMDIQMPVLDGHGATQKLRQLEYGKPIIALTAHALNEERSRCFASGFTDFLTKPIQKDTLVDVLSRYTVPTRSPALLQ